MSVLCLASNVLLFTERNGLSGTLASELKELTDLQFLLLEDGVISGEIPSEIGSLSTLEVIDMNFNFLGGSIPGTIYNLSNLRQFDMNDNALTGTIGTQIGQLTKLEFLQLHQNMFIGTIPSEIGQLGKLGKHEAVKDTTSVHFYFVFADVLHPSITYFFPGVATFHNNRLQGSMPETICALRAATVLEELTTDCGAASQAAGSPPFVACNLTCCTKCF